MKYNCHSILFLSYVTPFKGTAPNIQKSILWNTRHPKTPKGLKSKKEKRKERPTGCCELFRQDLKTVPHQLFSAEHRETRLS